MPAEEDGLTTQKFFRQHNHPSIRTGMTLSLTLKQLSIMIRKDTGDIEFDAQICTATNLLSSNVSNLNFIGRMASHSRSKKHSQMAITFST